MIIKGAARGRSQQLARHLLREDENETIRVHEVRGTVARDLPGALLEMEARGAASGSARPLYHASLSPEAHTPLTEAQVRIAVDALEHKLGFANQPRVVVLHKKSGREHVHVVWSRIDVRDGRAIPDSWNYRLHEEVARELEAQFGHRTIPGNHAPRKRTEGLGARTGKDYEYRQAERLGGKQGDVTAELTALWKATGGGEAFRKRLEAEGYVLARGDRRVFVVIDRAGEVHSLARRLDGVDTRALRKAMRDLPLSELPSVAEVRDRLHERSNPRTTNFRPAAKEVTGHRSVKRPGDVGRIKTAMHRTIGAQLDAVTSVRASETAFKPARVAARAPVLPIDDRYRALRSAIVAHYATLLAEARCHTTSDRLTATLDALYSERQAALRALAREFRSNGRPNRRRRRQAGRQFGWKPRLWLRRRRAPRKHPVNSTN